MEMITQNNILIAEFMGFKKDSPSTNWYYDLKKSRYYRLNELLYDTDWNWLMDVVDKIDSLGFVTEISGNIERSFALIGLANSNSSISRVGYGVEFMNKKDATYRAVIEFITWYNEQTKQK
jgi:hypothetical protein